METVPEAPRGRSAAARFFAAPLSLRSYANLLFLVTAFPLGLIYFVLLVVGISLGFGLLVLVVGLPILALVLLASWGLSSVERQLAIHLLGAEVPPMKPAAGTLPALPDGAAPRLRERAWAFLSNPVTWKGMVYLLFKLPFGVLSFSLSISLVTLSGSLILAPFLYRLNDWTDQDVVINSWPVDSLGRAIVCMAVGLVVGLLSIHLLNGVAWLWKQLATAMLGSRRFAIGPLGPMAPVEAAEAA